MIVGLLKLRIHESVFGIPGKYLFPDLLNYTKNTKKNSGIIICYLYIFFSLTECPKNPFGHSVSLTVVIRAQLYSGHKGHTLWHPSISKHYFEWLEISMICRRITIIIVSQSITSKRVSPEMVPSLLERFRMWYYPMNTASLLWIGIRDWKYISVHWSDIYISPI